MKEEQNRDQTKNSVSKLSFIFPARVIKIGIIHLGTHHLGSERKTSFTYDAGKCFYFKNTIVCAVSLAAGKEVVVAVQSLSRVCLFVTPGTAVCQDSLSFTISQRLLRLMSPESVMLSNHLVLCWPFSFWKEAGMQKH